MNRIDAQIERLDRICDGIRAVLPESDFHGEWRGGRASDMQCAEQPCPPCTVGQKRQHAVEQVSPGVSPSASQHGGPQRQLATAQKSVEYPANQALPSPMKAEASERQEHPPTPLPLAGGLPDFGRPLGRAKTYTATIAWDPIGREWYGLCGLCKGDLGSINDADIGHYVTCDCCATDNFIERED